MGNESYFQQHCLQSISEHVFGGKVWVKILRFLDFKLHFPFKNTSLIWMKRKKLYPTTETGGNDVPIFGLALLFGEVTEIPTCWKKKTPFYAFLRKFQRFRKMRCSEEGDTYQYRTKKQGGFLGAAEHHMPGTISFKSKMTAFKGILMFFFLIPFSGF